jgi:hypothetical protein
MAWPGQTMVAAAVDFNGATSSQTWNSRNEPIGEDRHAMLQWGHVLSDVE